MEKVVERTRKDAKNLRAVFLTSWNGSNQLCWNGVRTFLKIF